MSGPTLAEGRRYQAGIVVESWRLWEAVQGTLPNRRVISWRLDSDYWELCDGRLAAVIAQGAPMAADSLERLAGAGASRVVRLGTTGGLQAGQAVGDVVLPYCAVRDEGTSAAYLPPTVPACADLALVQDLCAALEARMGRPHRPVISWTTDARWVETDEQIMRYSELGVAAVDMESAALFAAASVRSVSAASVSIIADLPIQHVGQQFKGLPPGEAEWTMVTDCARTVFGVIVDALQAP